MMDRAYLDRTIGHLTTQGVAFEPGLSANEADRAERTFGFRFPPDLRSFLQHALPVSDGFPNWRGGDLSDLRWRMGWPLEGLLFDVEHNAFWLDAWGARPARPADAFDVVRAAVAGAPTLIPIYSHRFLPADPGAAGNPVFSVHGRDIIVYGNDLADYFHREFDAPSPPWAAASPRPIPLWGALVAENDRPG